MKRALITGITGQDGSYLAELLIGEGYEVHGTVRRVALEDPSHRLTRIAGILDRTTLHAASLESFPSLYAAIAKVQPDELYHLASQSFVSHSFEDAFSTFRTNIDGTHYVLESVRQGAQSACTRILRRLRARCSGNAQHTPQNEKTPFSPRSPYGVLKVTGLSSGAKLPRGVRACTSARHSLQSRVTAARVRVCDSQDYVACGAN